jgi:hypothetical protein
VINLIDKLICMVTDPTFVLPPPPLMHKREFKDQMSKIKRLQLLNENLRLGHVVEGATTSG